MDNQDAAYITIQTALAVVAPVISGLSMTIYYLYRQIQHQQDKIISITEHMLESQNKQRESFALLARQVEKAVELVERAADFNELAMELLRKSLK